MNSGTYVDVGNDQHAPLVDVMHYVRVLWARKGTILSITALMVLGALAYVSLTNPVYTASAVILVDPRETRTTGTESVLPGIGSDSAAIASQVALIKSREILGPVFESEAIANDPEFTNPGLVSGMLNTILGRRPTVPASVTFDRFAGHLSAEREGLTYVLDISFRSQDREKAARIVNAIVDAYINNQVSQKSSANSDATEQLGERVEGLQRSVRDAEQQVEEFKVRHQIYDAAGGTTQLQSRVDQLNTQLLQAQEQARVAEGRYQQALAAGISPAALERLAQILSSPSADKLRDDYNARSAGLASAQALYGPRHPTLISQQAELARVEGMIVVEAKRITSQLKAEADLTSNTVASIEAELESLRLQLNDANRQMVELRQLERNAEASRGVLEQFQKRSEETGQLETLQVSDARVISSAAVPEAPTWPKPGLLLTVSFLLGLALGSAVALLRGMPAATQLKQSAAPATSDGASTPARVFSVSPAPKIEPDAAPVEQAVEPPTDAEPVERVEPPTTTEPLVASVPAASALPITELGVLKSQLRAPSNFREVPRIYIDASRNELTQNLGSPFAAGLQKLVRTLLQRLHPHKSPFVLLFSGPDRFESGRIAYNLAAGLQRIGATTLVIDLDPPAETIRGTSERPRLRDVLSGTTRLDLASLTDPQTGTLAIVHRPEHGPIPKLSLMEVGKIVAAVRGEVEFVVIVGGVVGSSAYNPALAAVVDQELFILGSGEVEPGLTKTIAALPAAADPLQRGIVRVLYGMEASASEATPSSSVQAAVAEIKRTHAHRR